MDRRTIKKDIAIVGISGAFPNSEDINAFWSNLVQGREMIHFYDSEELERLGVPRAQTQNENYVAASALIEGAENFDFSFFGYSHQEAMMMDPQIRLLHEYSWKALEDAGINLDTFNGKIGAFFAAGDNPMWRAGSLFSGNEDVNSLFLDQISNKNFVSSLIAYNFNLKGPSYYIDTACSSSLVSVHLACRNLILKECAVALAGGARIQRGGRVGYMFEEGMIHSRNGHCQPFDKNSSGTIAGEGVGVVVLKRLEDAIQDHDNVYAIIRASAVNNDGNRKVGYTAPSVAGQYECIKFAQKVADVGPELIDYVEAHGTATKIGDPVEIKALNRAFENTPANSIAIGSVKSNIGHLDAAAGVTGLIKVALSLKNKQIPPSINYTEPNPEIEFNKGPFFVVSELTQWEKKEPRFAAVSSFGIGGTNAHAILEEAPKVADGSGYRRYQIMPFSAKSSEAFERNKEAQRNHRETNKNSIADIAYTLKMGRKSFRLRGFDVVDTGEFLHSVISENEPFVAKERKCVFLFPGQGSQFLKMGKTIYEEESIFRKWMDLGFAHLKNSTGEDYAKIVGYSGAHNSEKDINNTKYTQPALFLLEYALAKLLMHWGAEPSKMMGHSLGEYVAACIAGTISFEDALSLVAKRGELMSQMQTGDMLAVAAPFDQLHDLISDQVSLAAVNTSESCVLSGKQELIMEVIARLDDRDISNKVLDTSHAFHSSMMDAMLDEYKLALNKVSFNAPTIPFISNLTGKEITNEEACSTEYWLNQLRSAVLFSEGINHVGNFEDLLFIEVGPGKVLSNFVRQNLQQGEAAKCINTLSGAADMTDDRLHLATALGTLWQNGIAINWHNYYEGEVRNKVSMPQYSFDKYKFPVTPELSHLTRMLEPQNNGIEDWFYIPQWKRSFADFSELANRTGRTYLVFADNDTLEFVQELSKGNKVHLVRSASSFAQEESKWLLNPQSEKDYTQLFNTMKESGESVDSIVYTWPIASSDAMESIKLTNGLVSFAKAVSKCFERVQISFISSLQHDNDSEIKQKNHVATALFGVLMQETEMIEVQFISVNDTSETKFIINEIQQLVSRQNVCYQKGKRWLLNYDQVKLKEPRQSKAFKKNGIYLITGGRGKVGTIFSNYLRDKYQATLLHVGRSEEQELEGIHYRKVDIADKTAFEKVVNDFESAYGTINGVLHLAGNTNVSTFKQIEEITLEIIESQFHSKALGTQNIYEIFNDKSVDFVWISSSLSTLLGGITFGAYAAANAYINSFVCSKQEMLKNWYCVNLDGISDQSKIGIRSDDIIKVLESSFLIEEAPELIVSIRNLHNTLRDQNEHLSKNRKEQKSMTIVARPSSISEYKPPTTEVEKMLIHIWQDFFKIEKIGINDNFFELGGDSLKGMTVSKRIQKAFNVDINLNEFYNKPTIFELAKEIELAKKMIEVQNPDNEGYNSLKL